MEDVHALAELSEIRRLLADIREAIVEPYGLIADTRRAEWGTASFDDVDLGGVFTGVLVVNETSADLYLGFGPGTGTSTRYEFIVPGRAWATIPKRCSLVSVGAAAAGVARVCPLLGSVEASLTS